MIAVSNRRSLYAIRCCSGVTSIRRPAEDIVFFLDDIGLFETRNQTAWLLILCLSSVIHRVDKLRITIATSSSMTYGLAWTRVCLNFYSQCAHLTLIRLLLSRISLLLWLWLWDSSVFPYRIETAFRIISNLSLFLVVRIVFLIDIGDSMSRGSLQRAIRLIISMHLLESLSSIAIFTASVATIILRLVV